MIIPSWDSDKVILKSLLVVYLIIGILIFLGS